MKRRRGAERRQSVGGDHDQKQSRGTIANTGENPEIGGAPATKKTGETSSGTTT
jgi:hypothetical protein